MKELENLRSDPTAWHSVAFEACRSDERGTFDGNAAARYRALLTLQYDRRDSDIELLRHLLVNEILAAEHDSFQGCDDALRLAAFLLASFRNPSDATLLARAKVANFDTACGFPIEFVFYAGGELTEQTIKANDPDLWDQLSSSFDLTPNSDDLDDWWRSIRNEYPDCEENEDQLTLYNKSLVLDGEKEARRYLEQWAAKEPESRSKWSLLKYEYTRLGDFAKAAQVAAGMLECSDSLWDKALAQCDLVKLHRQAGNFALAMEMARKLNSTFAAFDEWVGVGLGRNAIYEVFGLAIAHQEVIPAREAFSLADQWFQRSRDLALIGMKSGAKAAERCGLTDEAHEYEQIAIAEQERIDKMLETN